MRTIYFELLLVFCCYLPIMATATELPTSKILPTAKNPAAKKKKIAPLPLSSKPKEKISFLSLDPIRFAVKSNRDSVVVGETVELNISAELLDIAPSLFYFFEEQKGFSLKIVLPDGFVQTGGNYNDYVGGI